MGFRAEFATCFQSRRYCGNRKSEVGRCGNRNVFVANPERQDRKFKHHRLTSGIYIQTVNNPHII